MKHITVRPHCQHLRCSHVPCGAGFPTPRARTSFDCGKPARYSQLWRNFDGTMLPTFQLSAPQKGWSGLLAMFGTELSGRSSRAVGLACLGGDYWRLQW
eukprot:5702219-Amphidinium_carterae.2